MQTYRSLVVLQPTPFCNIDCKYCYLPQRSVTSRMSSETLRAIFSRVFASRLVEDPIVFLWHLGEPLAVPPSWYESAFALAAEQDQAGSRHSHCFQTNGTLIDPDWVAFFKRHSVSLGVSIDGPAHLHDRVRLSKRGGATHARVMRGIRALQEGGVPFSVIMVLTSQSLDHADEICDFFLDNGIHDIDFNIDEVEGINRVSSFRTAEAVARFQQFFLRLVERSAASEGRMRVREVWSNLRTLTGKPSGPLNTTNQPFRIFNFDWEGNFSTFCPELVAGRSEEYNHFRMGNVHRDSLDDIVDDPVFQRVNREVQEGVRACKESCPYWDYCGGGSPSNKFFEHGRFDRTETITCRLHRQAVIDVLVEYLERRLNLGLLPTPGEALP